MNNQSLTDMLKDARTNPGRASISLHEVTLVYDMDKFKEEPKYFIEEQLKTHKNCLGEVNKELSDAYIKWNDKLEKESDLERIFQFIPENTKRPVIELAKIIAAPAFLIEFTTLRSNIVKNIQDNEVLAETYKSIKEVIDYGKEFFDNCKILHKEIISEETMLNLDECVGVIKELSYRYARLTETTRKIAEVDKRLYELLFPNKNCVVLN